MADQLNQTPVRPIFVDEVVTIIDGDPYRGYRGRVVAVNYDVAEVQLFVDAAGAFVPTKPIATFDLSSLD